ncbi:hypothetical protein [Agromyces sp. NBRC 114283]|uniref:hypothetical protein n=1 Tax=Agromyces sp. NBRC 114283 TaxID=2994521 RepID=UPI0024A303A2|nr:hypothetical protein [Agromyces sp. NBRC 114283]GLU91325.1 hypothetical protein Agsp01_35800 [Agromyces sp. NBRC 114283]
MSAPDLSPEEKATVARFGIHSGGDGIPEVRVERDASRYLGLDEVNAFRLAGVPVTDTPDPLECCASCRRGTKSLGEFPCGRDGKCRCHGGRPR